MKRTLLSSTNLPIELRLAAGSASKAWKRGERLRTFMVISLAREGEPLRIPESRIRKGRSASGTCWIAVSDRGSWNLAVWNDANAAAPYSLALPLPDGAGKVLWSDSDGRRGEGVLSGEKIEGRLEGEGLRVMRVGGK